VFSGPGAFTSTQLIIVVAGALLLVGVGVYVIIRVRRKPKDKEQRRRLTVNQEGRIGDATITDIQEGFFFYSYSISGVAYTASQDVSKLGEHLPANPERLIGQAASLKYAPQNPANSILVCEHWSGLRVNPPAGS
jgi:hypothetical protein